MGDFNAKAGVQGYEKLKVGLLSLMLKSCLTYKPHKPAIDTNEFPDIDLVKTRMILGQFHDN